MKFFQEELKTLILQQLLNGLNSIGVKVNEVRVIPDIEKQLLKQLII